MSSFICEKCGKMIIDTEDGYITGCKHYPQEIFPCYNRNCEFYDEKMFENCSKGEEPNTRMCKGYISFEMEYIKSTTPRLKAGA